MLVSSVGGGGRRIPVYHWLVFGEENPLLDLLELVLGGKDWWQTDWSFELSGLRVGIG